MAFLQIALGLATFAAMPGAVPEAARPEATAKRVAVGPRLDGRLDDEVWRAAPVLAAFTQRFPDDGRPPSEATRARVLYDDRAIYIGIECEQRRAPISRRLTRRDRVAAADRVEVDLGSRGDATSAFSFSVSAAGGLADGLYYDDTKYAREWDENWDARVATTDDGWSVEMMVPLRVLRFDRADEQAWRFNVRRFVAARNEMSEWAYAPRTQAGHVSRMGELTQLRHLGSPSPLELRPQALARVAHAETGAKGVNQGASVEIGVDGKWHVTRDLTLDATVNPDFAQVEADEPILNLSTYEAFFPEKRPFFSEGLQAFRTPRPILHTRRIGRAPPRPATRPGEAIEAAPEPTPIWGAAKLTGRLVPGLEVGLLSALTGDNRVHVADGLGGGGARAADVPTMFNLVRVKALVGGNAHVGAAAGATLRRERGAGYATDGEAQLCPGGARVAPGARCLHDAYVGAVDGRWRSPSGDYAVAGQATLTAIDGGPDRVGRDGTVIGDGATDGLFDLGLAKEGGRRWLWQLNVSQIGRRADLNDLGYLQRQNLRSGFAALTWRRTEPFAGLLEGNVSLRALEERNLDGVVLNRRLRLTGHANHASFWNAYAELARSFPRYDDREIGDGTALEHAGSWTAELAIGTPPQRDVVGHGWIEGEVRASGRDLRGGGEVILHALPALELGLGPRVGSLGGEPRFVARGPHAGDLVFGREYARYLGVTLRATAAFSPRLSLQAYAQAFVSRAEYRDFHGATGTRPGDRVALASLAPTAAPAGDPDVERVSFNGSVVLRWEFALGSTLFVVYSRAQAGSVAVTPGEGAERALWRLAHAPAANVFVAKLSYWWG